MLPSDVSIGLQEIVCHFDELEDPRSTINRLHPLPSVLTIALMGVLAGAKGPTGIAKWAFAKKELLQQGLDLPNGIPLRDVIRRVLSAVKVEAFQSSFVSWLNSLFEAAKEKKGPARMGAGGTCGFCTAPEHNPIDPALFRNHMAARNPVCEQSSPGGYRQRSPETAKWGDRWCSKLT